MVNQTNLLESAPFSDLNRSVGGNYHYATGEASQPRRLPPFETWICAAGLYALKHEGHLRTFYEVTPGFNEVSNEVARVLADYHQSEISPHQSPNPDPKEEILINKTFCEVVHKVYPARQLLGGIAIHAADGDPKGFMFFATEFSELAGHPDYSSRFGSLFREADLSPLARWARGNIASNPSGLANNVAEFANRVASHAIARRLFTFDQLIEELKFTPQPKEVAPQLKAAA